MVRSLKATVLVVAGVLLAAIPPATAAAAGSPTATKDRLEQYWRDTYTPTASAAHSGGAIPLLAKAPADECFGEAGDDYAAKTDGVDCAAGRVPKVNQAYVWGLTKTNEDLWFGTAPNVLCLVFSGYLGMTSSMENDSWACEFGDSGYRRMVNTPVAWLPAPLGDWRPSKLYRYDDVTGDLEDLGAKLPADAVARLNQTLGIRSAGSLGRTVIFAGPGMATGINVFVFDAKSGDYVGSTTLSGYDNIRRWIVADGKLYTAVGRKGRGGALLRWDGNADDPATATQAASFTEVGTLPAEGADLAAHEGRIYVTTWPETTLPVQEAGLYRSDPIAALHAGGGALAEVWTASDYEPDATTAATYGGGALASYDGKLVWGTMHVPFTATLAHFKVWGADYGDKGPSTAQTLAGIAGTMRAVALFSGSDLATDHPKVRLLYGNTMLPAYSHARKTWVIVPNTAHQVPKLGQAGFDNPFNNYTWVMGQTDRGLYVGTMDWSYLLAKAIPLITEQISGRAAKPEALDLPTGTYGADLMKFRSLRKAARGVSRSGVGNFANYGVRTMVAEPERLYIGTANPMNLMPQGGWELRRIGPGEEPTTPEEPPVQPDTKQTTAPSTAPVTTTVESKRCISTRRFTMHLGFRLKVATARGMRNVKSIRATVNGKAVKAKRTTRGITVPVDLRSATTTRSKVRVQLKLRTPVAVQRRDGGTARATSIDRTYVFTTCS